MAASATFAAPRRVAATATSNAALGAGRHTPVDASSGARTMSLPTGKREGAVISLEKIDSTTNTVTVTGHMRGTPNQSVVLSRQHDGTAFLADSSGSWWPLRSILPTGQTARDALSVYSKAEVDNKLEQLRVELGGDPDPPDPGGTTSTLAMAYPTHAVEAYQMMWAADTNHLGSLHENVNVIKPAFMDGDAQGVPKLVGFTNAGLPTLQTQVAELRARGVRIVPSVGGSAMHPDNNNTVNWANTSAFVAGVLAVRTQLGAIDGIDFDYEHGTNPTPGQAVAIVQALRAECGPNFVATMAPNGSTIGDDDPLTGYLAVGKALYDADVLGSFMHQFYDAVVSQGAMLSRLNQWVGLVGAGGEKVYSIGCMNPLPATGHAEGAAAYWTTAQSLSMVRAARAAFPDLGHAGLWELGRNDTAAWCDQVGDVVFKLSA